MPTGGDKSCYDSGNERNVSKASNIVLLLVLIAGTAICVLWWGMLALLLIVGVRLLFRVW